MKHVLCLDLFHHVMCMFVVVSSRAPPETGGGGGCMLGAWDGVCAVARARVTYFFSGLRKVSPLLHFASSV